MTRTLRRETGGANTTVHNYALRKIVIVPNSQDPRYEFVPARPKWPDII